MGVATAPLHCLHREGAAEVPALHEPRALTLIAPAAEAEAGTAPRESAERRLPADVLAHCIAFAAGSFRDLRSASLVNSKWHAAAAADSVWADVTRRCFCAFPIVRLADTLHSRPGLMALTQSSESQRVLPGRELYIRHRIAQHQWRMRLCTRREVLWHTPYVLHALLALSWAAAWVFFFTLACIQERLVTSLSYEHPFRLLYVVYAIIWTTLGINVVATSHYEPESLFGRMQKHSGLIALTACSMAMLMVIALVTRLVHSNVVAEPQDRRPWQLVIAPGTAVPALWQLLSLPSGLRALRRWAARPHLPTLGTLHALVTYMYPLMCCLSLASLALYLEGAGQAYLVAASVPYLLGNLTLMATFTFDWLLRRELSDALCSFGFVLLSAFPIGYIVWPEPRGAHLLPLLLFLTTHMLTYAANWRRKVARDRLLRPAWRVGAGHWQQLDLQRPRHPARKPPWHSVPKRPLRAHRAAAWRLPT